MRDKNGIEIKCANCHYQSKSIGQCLAELVHPKCENGSLFEPKLTAIEARIRELKGMAMQAAMLAEKVPQLEKRIAELEEANKDLSEGMNIGYWLGRHDGRCAETGTKE